MAGTDWDQEVQEVQEETEVKEDEDDVFSDEVERELAEELEKIRSEENPESAPKKISFFKKKRKNPDDVEIIDLNDN